MWSYVVKRAWKRLRRLSFYGNIHMKILTSNAGIILLRDPLFWHDARYSIDVDTVHVVGTWIIMLVLGT